MRIQYIAERGDRVVVTLAGGRTAYAKIANVADDGSIYCIKTDGRADFIADKYTWDRIEECWSVKGENVTL